VSIHIEFETALGGRTPTVVVTGVHRIHCQSFGPLVCLELMKIFQRSIHHFGRRYVFFIVNFFISSYLDAIEYSRNYLHVFSCCILHHVIKPVG
jgi:hypothetical protein